MNETHQHCCFSAATSPFAVRDEIQVEISPTFSKAASMFLTPRNLYQPSNAFSSECWVSAALPTLSTPHFNNANLFSLFLSHKSGCCFLQGLHYWLFAFLFFFFNSKIIATLCWFLPYINMDQPQVYICPLPCKPPSSITLLLLQRTTLYVVNNYLSWVHPVDMFCVISTS